ncbi:MAG: hypothetical protein KIT35_09320 [Piscinibacter sp.]|uniref:hypothetical protein n=1 Tax=Piscinibacter sp. TaxID=1903157 RepID=UPI0025861E23|nr:hypothetical protein [Piscinibacter sp.]MCW5664021.1 hypothetical protein [Piscinibacter sp.]
MPNETLPKVDLSDPDACRREFARSAACEMSQILDVLDEQQRAEEQISPSLWRGMYLRLDTLVSVTISAMSDYESKLEDMADALYGPGRWNAEAGHV